MFHFLIAMPLRRVAMFLTMSLVSLPALAQSNQPNGGFRQLAPGVVTVIPPELEEQETFSGPRPLVELIDGVPDLAWDPHFWPKSDTLYAMAQDVIFRRDVWGLELGFKPLRMITVDVPQADGSVQTKLVWYLVYYVKNPGKQFSPSPQEGERGNTVYNIESINHTVRFFPSFTLQGHEVRQAYLDSVIPEAVEKIRQREDPNRTFHNSVSISQVAIEPSTEEEDNRVWGVATWVDVDPRIDFFSVFVGGLTNAYRWEDPEGAFQPGDPPGTGRRFAFKTLQLNFWRPGDEITPNEAEIRYGIPTATDVPAKSSREILQLYGLEERVDHRWIYR